MVRGLDKFKEYFADFGDSYVLIGGLAAVLSMEEMGFEFRATKDFDIVLCVEAIDERFVGQFWRFIREGGYAIRQGSTGNPVFYRFSKPTARDFPAMLELFSKAPGTITLAPDSILTPIPAGGEVSSLSAILLNPDYECLIQELKRTLDGISFVGPRCLIPLKLLAYFDLSRRRNAGETVDSSNIKKHKNDVFRLAGILTREPVIVSEVIRADMRKTLEILRGDLPDLRQLGIFQEAGVILAEIERIYAL